MLKAAPHARGRTPSARPCISLARLPPTDSDIPIGLKQSVQLSSPSGLEHHGSIGLRQLLSICIFL